MIAFLILTLAFACIVQFGGTFPLGSVPMVSPLPFSPSRGTGAPGITETSSCGCDPGGPGTGGYCWGMNLAPLPDDKPKAISDC